jgi:putative DNA primase/helicase
VTAEEIARRLGGAQKLSNGGWLCFCPAHDNRHTPALSIRDGESVDLVVHCFSQCSPIDVLRALRERGLIAEPTHYRRWLDLWDEAQPIGGTLGERYLHGRCLVLPRGAEMRFHPQCPRERDCQPAVVMLMRDIITNEPHAIQRRFLRADGSKDGPAMSLGPTKGTAWKLTPDEDVTTGLGIAEGHADALAALNDGFAPMWATAGTPGMAAFPVLNGVEALTIFCDLNTPGEDFAAMVEGHAA